MASIPTRCATCCKLAMLAYLLNVICYSSARGTLIVALGTYVLAVCGAIPPSSWPFDLVPWLSLYKPNWLRLKNMPSVFTDLFMLRLSECCVLTSWVSITECVLILFCFLPISTECSKIRTTERQGMNLKVMAQKLPSASSRYILV